MDNIKNVAERMNLSMPDAVTLVQQKVFGWLETAISMVPNLMVAFIVLFLFIVLGRLMKFGIKRFGHRLHGNDALINLFASIFNLLVIATGLFVALSVLQLDKTVTSLLAGAGVMGIALGFAFQDTAANFLAGIMIAFRKPYEINDIIEAQGYMGTIDRINLRTTVLKTFQGQEVLMPNNQIFRGPIVNYSISGKRRIDLNVGVSYGDDLQKVKQVILDALKGADFLEKDTEVKVGFYEFGDSSINLTIRFWIGYPAQPDFNEAKSNAIMKIKKAFDENDITIPFPIRTLDFGIKGGTELSEIMIAGKSVPYGNGIKE